MEMKKYSYDEVFRSTLDYFNGDEMQTNVWISKYCLKDSYDNYYELNPNMMFERIAKEIYRIEQKYPNPISYDEIYNLIKDFKYIIPGGSNMAGIGNDLQITSLSNCFVIGNEYDSYGGIIRTDEEQVHLMKRRGGVGHDLSHIRPKGSSVKNSALTSTGVVPFMERYSNSTKEVAQDGRRGALMLSIDINHLDAEDFIDAKLESGKVTNANISVKITDEFMESVQNDTKYIQKYPVNSDNPLHTKEIDAKRLWDKIVHNAWKSAEPGILFWNNIIKESPADCYTDYGFATKTTNPCVIGDTLIFTNYGLLKIKTLYEIFNKDSDLKILTRDKEGKFTLSELKDVLLTEKKATLYKTIFSNGTYIITNGKHKLYDNNYNELSIIDLYENSIQRNDITILCGNGVVSINSIAKLNYKEDVYDLTACPNYNFFSILDHEEVFFDGCEDVSHLFNHSIIEELLTRAILNVDCGEIPLCPNDSCRLLAINLYNYVRNPFTKNAIFDLPVFINHVNKAQKIMDDIVDLEIEHIDKILDKIDSDPESEDIKNTEYDLWEKIKEKALQGRRTGLGITGEGDMLAALGLIYGSQEAIDFSKNIHAHLAVNSYISSIDMSEVRGAFEIWNYELEKDNPFINRLFDFIKDEQNGYNYDTIRKKYLKFGRRNISSLTIAPTGTVSIMTQTTSGIEPVFSVKYKRKRKINANDKVDTNKELKKDDEGNVWEEYNLYHKPFLLWAELNEYTIKDINENFDKIFEKSPYYKATANDINWVDSIKMQAANQLYIDHSISKTCNLPQTASEDLVNQVYLEAWKSGCKGITIYRDGSRDGILTIDKEIKEKNEYSEYNAPKRPKILECEVIRFYNDNEKWIGVLGLLDSRPYELFTGKLEKFNIPASINKGYIIRNKDKEHNITRYDFRYVDADGYNVTMEGLNRAFNRETWNYGKLISGILRHGMPLQCAHDLVDSLKFDFDEDNINNWKTGVKRMIKKYIKDGVKSKERCPNCGNELVFSEGCKKCLNCSWSKCG